MFDGIYKIIIGFSDFVQILEPWGGWNLVYFVFEVIITFLIVQRVFRWSEKKNWRRSRQNYAQNLYDKTCQIVCLFEKGVHNFEPFRSKTSIDKGNRTDRTQYLMDEGTALLVFGSDVQSMRDELQSMKLGFTMFDAELTEIASNYHSILDKINEMTGLLIQLDEVSSLPELTQEQVERLESLKLALFKPEIIIDKLTGEKTTISSPFLKLFSHIINFGTYVEYVHFNRKFARQLQIYDKVTSSLFPTFVSKNRNTEFDEIVFGPKKKIDLMGPVYVCTILKQQCIEIDSALRRILMV